MKRSTRHLATTTLVFAALTLLFNYPVWTAPNRLLADNLDGRLTAWIMAWDAHALASPSTPLFDANIFHPFARTLAYSENLLGAALLVAPLNWAGFPVLAFNVVFLLSFLLCGIAMTLWTREIVGSWAAGILAGVVWAFAPSKTDHLSHLQLLASMWVPLALWLLTLYVRTRRRGLILLAAGLLGLQYWTGIQATLVTVPFVALWFLLAWWHRPSARAGDWRRLLLEAVPAAALCLLMVVPVSLPYLEVSAGQGFSRSLAETVQYNARPLGFLAGSWSNRAAHMQALHRTFGKAEGNHGLGVVGSLLLAAAVVMAMGVVARGLRRRRADAPDAARARRLAFVVSALTAAVATVLHLAGVVAAVAGPAASPGRWLITASDAVSPALWMAGAGTLTILLWRPGPGVSFRQRAAVILLWLAGIAYLLSLGPAVYVRDTTLGTGPFALLYEWAVPYRSIRSVGRFGIGWALVVAPLVGLAADALGRRISTAGERRARARWLLFLVLGTGLVLEFRTWPLHAADGTLHDPEVYAALAELPGEGGVLHLPPLPWGNPASATQYMLGSTLHWRPLVNGYSGFFPGDHGHLLRLDPTSPVFWDRLATDFATDHVVVHGRHYPDSEYGTLIERLQHNPELRVVREFENATIFAFEPGVERGNLVQRRFPGSRLRRSAGISFDVRGLGPARDGSIEAAHVLWSDAPAGECPLTGIWTRCTVTPPDGWTPDADGTATVQIWNPPPPGFGVPLGGTATLLATELLVDAQLNAVGLARDDRWERVHPSSGALVAHMDVGGRRLRDVRVFPTTDAGMAGLEAHVREGVPEGHIVAVALHLLTDRPSREARTSDIRAALRAIGASGDLPEDTWVHAILGVRGATPGEALEEHAATWASIRVGPPDSPSGRIAVRDIRLLERPPSSGP